MQRIRHADERGTARFPGLTSHHSFSFGSYQDPANEQVSVLRVINDDTLTAGAGFPTHGHQDMEIISWVLDGVLEHKDSLGNVGAVNAGEMQVMGAGTGIRHSEYNGRDASLNFLQIWILPDARGHAPRWQQVDVRERIAAGGQRVPLVTAVGRDDAPMQVHQDVRIDALALTAGDELDVTPAADRLAYLHVTEGSLEIGGRTLAAGDAIALDDRVRTVLTARDDVRGLIFDLPPGRVALTGTDLDTTAAA